MASKFRPRVGFMRERYSTALCPSRYTSFLRDSGFLTRWQATSSIAFLVLERDRLAQVRRETGMTPGEELLDQLPRNRVALDQAS